MRSTLVGTLLVLGACNKQADAPDVVTVDLKGIPDAPLPPAPDAQQPAPETTSTVVPPTISVRPKHAFGTEPFWSFTIKPNTMEYATPEVTGIEVPMKSEQKDGVWRFTAVLQGKPMTLKIEPGECNDGMSDNTYMFKAEFTWDGKTERGCAKPN